MYGLQIGQFVVVGVDADAEEEARVAAVDDFEGAEFDEVGLVLLVSGGDEAMDLVVGHVLVGGFFNLRGGGGGGECDGGFVYFAF